MAVLLLPALPAREKFTKSRKKYFENSKKIAPKIKIKRLFIQALATQPKHLITHFESL
jgi:hypothetical protein